MRNEGGAVEGFRAGERCVIREVRVRPSLRFRHLCVHVYLLIFYLVCLYVLFFTF